MRISIAEETVRKMFESERRIRKSLAALRVPTEITKEQWQKLLAVINDERSPD